LSLGGAEGGDGGDVLGSEGLPEGRGSWEGGCEGVLLLLFFHCRLLALQKAEKADSCMRFRNGRAKALRSRSSCLVAVVGRRVEAQAKKSAFPHFLQPTLARLDFGRVARFNHTSTSSPPFLSYNFSHFNSQSTARIPCLISLRFLRHVRRFLRTKMPRSSQSPDGGLAARTGCIGSIARFWQVGSLSYLSKISLLIMNLQKTYAPDYLGFVLLMAAYFSVCSPRQ
jgi:hypothetical protein